MKEIIRHTFERNGASIACYYCNSKSRKKEKVHDDDCICLSFEREEKTKIFLRPDEALLVAKQLVDSVLKLTNSYEMRLLSKNNY